MLTCEKQKELPIRWCLQCTVCPASEVLRQIGGNAWQADAQWPCPLCLSACVSWKDEFSIKCTTWSPDLHVKESSTSVHCSLALSSLIRQFHSHLTSSIQTSGGGQCPSRAKLGGKDAALLPVSRASQAMPGGDHPLRHP